MKRAPHLLVFRSVPRYTCLAGRGRGAALIEFGEGASRPADWIINSPSERVTELSISGLMVMPLIRMSLGCEMCRLISDSWEIW